MRTAICISTYNEASSIGPLVRSFSRLGWTVIVSDGGSSDTTTSLAIDAGAIVIHPTIEEGRIGIGKALMRAWKYALDHGFDAVVQIDAGGSHRPYELMRLLIHARSYDMVIGSRFLPRSQYIHTPENWKRPLLSRVASFMMNIAQAGAHYSDWTSGYRYFNRKALDFLLKQHYQTDMHTWQIEVLAHAGAAGFRIIEVPITYTAGRSSFSKKIAWEALMTWLHVMHHVGWVGSTLHLD